MLEFSNTSGYAILALCHVAGRGARWVLAREIAAETGIAGPYLSKILHTLVKAGLLRAKRGYRGGVALARPARQINILEVVGVIERQPRAPGCLLGLSDCSDLYACPVHRVWKVTRAQVERSLRRLTLAAVARTVLARRCQTLPSGCGGGASASGPPDHSAAVRKTAARRDGKRTSLTDARPTRRRGGGRAAMRSK
jgi:Rrf2 family protein